MELLTGGARDLPARQQTLRAAIGWSYSLLSSDEQAVFRRLAVFTAGCMVEDAEAVCEAPGHLSISVVDAIQALATSNLVETVPGQNGVTRLRMLETIREYALECLTASNERERLSREHAGYFLGMAERAEDGLTGERQPEWLDRMEADHANLLTALRHFRSMNDAQSAVQLISVLWRFWWRRGYLSEGRSHVAGVLDMEGVKATAGLRARALLAAGLLALWQADYQDARTLLDETIEVAGAAGDDRTQAYAFTFLGRVARDLGEADAARLGAQGVRLFEEVGDRWGLGVAQHFLGLSVAQYDVKLARTFFEESLATFGDLGVRGDMAMPYRGMGLLHYLQGEYEEARNQFERSASLFRSVGDEWSSSMVMHDLGSVAETQGLVGEASAFLTESLRTWRKLGNKRGSLICMAGLARVALHVGAHDLAVRLLAAIDAICTEAHIVLEPTDSRSIEGSLEQSRRLLGEAAFSETWTQGRRLGFEAAVTLAYCVEEGVRAVRDTGRGPSRSPVGHLSPREREVAALLPLGMTNRQIAEALTITEGTANLHVKHILNKLGFSSRAQIAAWVVQNGLDDAAVEAGFRPAGSATLSHEVIPFG
jgi:DNA-binding CsgD family transcriptional regulator/tetratricopeptide (TPR) repeat protein